jgi:hypothetical protein
MEIAFLFIAIVSATGLALNNHWAEERRQGFRQQSRAAIKRLKKHHA